MLSMKNTGIRNESIVITRTILVRITAITAYIIDSLSERCFISAVIADIPLMKHCSFVISLILSIAARVPSAEVVSSKNTAIRVVSSLLKKSYIFCGRTSFGIFRSVSDS